MNTKDTAKIIVECKKPKRKDGIEQLKSYMNAKGAPVVVWSNGSDSPVGYTARFSVVGLADSVNANRIDAQCFSPEAVFYEDWLLKYANCNRLSLMLTSTAKGRQQAEAETGITDYCSIKHITGREIVGASKAYPAAGTPSARKDDLLLAITGATIGKIGIVNRYDNLVFSGDMLRLRANSTISPHYLLLILDHHLGQVQFNRWITGSTNGHLAPRDVGRVLVPRLAPETEKQMAALVAESLEKRQESEQLLDQAKSRVEQLIEDAVRGYRAAFSPQPAPPSERIQPSRR